MRPRQDITEMFSTFIKLENNQFSKWVIDIKLRQSMQNCLDCPTFVSKQENFWGLYWHNRWKSSSQSNYLAKMHLQAYLQEPCYHIYGKSISFLADDQYSIADVFQMANAEVEPILNDFNPRKSSSLKSYFTMAIKSRLRDILRQRKQADPCSNWALLRKVSKKVYLEALAHAGFKPSAIAQYRLAWICFKELYVQKQPGGTNALPEPTPQLWQAIANEYNHSRHQLKITPECTAQEIKSWLNQSAKYVRVYSFPPVYSLDIKPSDNEQSVDLQDPNSEELIADLIAQEDIQDRQNQINRMFDVISSALKAMELKSQEILRLYYIEQLTQQEIMQQLQISQPTVSRKLVKARESLLLALVEWSRNMNISVNPNQINDMSIALEEWLTNQFGDFNINP